MDEQRCEIIVKGKIGTVRWLEAAPYHATKIKQGRYFAYQLELPAAEAEALQLRLEGQEDAARYRDDSMGRETGVWCELRAIVAPQPLAAGWEPLARQLAAMGHQPTNARCAAHVDQLLAHLVSHPRLSEAEKMVVAGAMAALDLDDPAEAGAVYAEWRPRLAPLVAKVR